MTSIQQPVDCNDFSDLLGSDGPANPSSRSRPASRAANRPEKFTDGPSADRRGSGSRPADKPASGAAKVNLPRGNSANPELLEEKIRLVREQGDKIALANAQARGEFVSVVTVENTWAEILRKIRARMLAVPSRVAIRLNLSAHDLDILDREIREALRELGNAENPV